MAGSGADGAHSAGDEGVGGGEGGGDDDEFLIQFPPYGTNDVASVASYGDDRDGDNDNDGVANSNHYGSGGGAAGDGRISMDELPEGSTHGAATTATATATMTATEDMSSSLRQHSRQSSFAGSVMGGVNATASAGTASMATAAAQALFDLSVLLPAASATPPPPPPPPQQQQQQQHSRRIVTASGQRVDSATTGGDGRQSNGVVKSVAVREVANIARDGLKQQQQQQQNEAQNNSKSNQCVPWDDDDDMDLWRTTASTAAAPEKQQEPRTQQQLNGDMSSDGGGDPYVYTYGSGGDDSTVLPMYGANARSYIRDWSAAAIAAAASAPMQQQQQQQQQSRLPATERREKRMIRASLTESVGDSAEGQQQSPQPQKQIQEQTPNTGAFGRSTSDGDVDNVSPQDDDNDDPLSTRRHWMPDRLCRHCYSCEAQFTVFRRRHHCRLCGQVFCAACSAYFINVSDQATVDAAPPPPALESTTSAGSTTSPTAASVAVESAASVGDRLDRNKSPSLEGCDLHGSSRSAIVSSTASTSLAGASQFPSGQQTANPSTTTTPRRTIRACKMCYDQFSEADSGGSNILFGPSRGGQPAAQPSQTAVPPAPTQGSSERGVGILQNHLRPEGALDKVQKNNGEDSQAEELARQVDAEYAAALVGSPQAKSGDKVVHPAMLTPDAISSAQKASESQAQLGTRAQITDANRRLGMAAANHLEKMGKELLLSDAPLLLKEIGYTQSSSDPCEEGVVAARAERDLSRWICTLMMHATRCVQTVQQNVKDGDLLDILPYCKVKGEHDCMTLCSMAGFSSRHQLFTVIHHLTPILHLLRTSRLYIFLLICPTTHTVIPGGTISDCAYMSGLIFRKNVSHKSMAREINEPRIMLLSGGIEFSRGQTQRMASLETILEQENKFMEILVNKIIKLKPDILFVGRSVSRKAQELLLKANVVLFQHVKSSLMSKISRQTGATILTSTDYVLFQKKILGTCKRFRLVTFRDNESWSDTSNAPGSKGSVQNIHALLAREDLPNHRRQAVLAADVLGEEVKDGSDAVREGLAKRGVALTYTMLEGCPKHLGCTVVLRGASRQALKQVKRVFQFIVNVAYNLRLETSYLRERRAMLPPDYSPSPKLSCSSSLCIDYGEPPHGRKVRPWNGGKNDTSQRSLSGKITAFDHQSILITSVWMLGKNQCCPAEVKGICYYSVQDVSLGQFLRDSCFNLALKCQNPSCKKSVLDHSLSFIHNDGLINITVEAMDGPLPPGPNGSKDTSSSAEETDKNGKPVDKPIATWTYCTHCSKVVTPLNFISEDTWKLSFGKFLETFFYNRTATLNAPEHSCKCQMQTNSTLYFGCGQLAARFTYEKVKPFGVFVRKILPFEGDYHRNESLRQLDLVSTTSSQLFSAFDQHIERITREARNLFGSPNRADHLQTIVAELNGLGSEVVHASTILQEKIGSVSRRFQDSSVGDAAAYEALFDFPWQSRRYLFMLTSAWNERLSAIGRALTAMKKLSKKAAAANSRDLAIQQSSGDTHDEVKSAIKRINQLKEVYAQFKVSDSSGSMHFPRGFEATGNSRRGGSARRVEDLDNIDIALDPLYDEEDEVYDGGGSSNDPDSEYLAGLDADVLASRRRMQERPRRSRSVVSDQGEGGADDVQLPLGNRQRQESYRRQTSAPVRGGDKSDQMDGPNKGGPVSAGGAVKSALTRLFNRGAKDSDPWKVDLGILNDGRPRLEPGSKGRVVPVFDDQPSSIIAYSLSSIDYENQFKFFTTSGPSSEASSTSGNRDDRSIDDIFTGAGGASAQQKSGMRRTTSGNKQIGGITGDRKNIERQMLVRAKSHIKHTFRDFDSKGQVVCKFVCTTYWATQFHAVRQAFLASSSSSQSGSRDSSSVSSESGTLPAIDVESSYTQSLSAACEWAVSGGKSGASFSKTDDGRFIVKCISRTELQMFLDCAPAYFEYLSKAFFHGLPTVLCKIVGVYQIGYHNRATGKRTMEQVAVMQNIFHGRKTSRVFDLKGSLRGRFTQQSTDKDSGGKGPTTSKHSGSSNDLAEMDRQSVDDVIAKARNPDSDNDFRKQNMKSESAHHGDDDGDYVGPSVPTLLDGDFLEFTGGRPLPLSDRSKAAFTMSILNDTLFLSIINVLDYSILVGIDEEKHELVVGIIDYMRQYDILKQMERVGKSLPMVVGSEAPTIIQPPLYKSRFTNAMERYFMTVPSKWTNI